MDAKTLEALKECIAIWGARYKKWNNELGINGCPLCWLFNSTGNNCDGCPVSEKSKMGYCENTPYGWVAFFRHIPGIRNIASYREYRFLKSLLPKETA